MSVIRLGIIGYGCRLHTMMSLFREAADNELKIVGLVDPDHEHVSSRIPERERSELRFFKSLPELVRISKPDALLIGTRCNLHAPYAIQAARYRLPLFLEKPVATSMRQALALERAFSRSRCQVVVSFPLRVTPLCTLARQLIDEGSVGRPEHILGVNYVPYGTCYFDQFYRDYSITQGLFLQKATHDFDSLSYLMGSNITRVAAMMTQGRVFGGNKHPGLTCSRCVDSTQCPESPANRQRNQSGGHPKDHLCLFSKDIGTPESGMNEDASSALLEFSSGAHGVYTQVFFSRRDAAARGATVSGYDGTVQYDWYKNQIHRVRHHTPFSDVITAGNGMSHFGGDEELARDFIGLIRGTRRSRSPIETGLASVYTCLAAKESAETKRFVRVRQVGQM